MAEDDLSTLGRKYARNLRQTDMEWLRARGLEDSTIRSAGLGYVESGRYADSISIPYALPYNGITQTIRFRYLNPITHKYDSYKGKNVHLYNVGNTLSDDVYICEGEFDSLILTQLGYPAVGIPGSNSFKSDWKYLFSNCATVTLVFDGDSAGVRGANRIASMLGEVVENLRIVRLPEDDDVTSLYMRDSSLLEGLLA